MHGGLKVAADQDWKSATRVLYHIADAPCHGSRFHNGVGDDYPHGHEKDTPAEQLIATLQGQQVVYFFGKLNTHTDKMITEFNKIAGSAYITTEDCRFVCSEIRSAAIALNGFVFLIREFARNLTHLHSLTPSLTLPNSFPFFFPFIPQVCW